MRFAIRFCKRLHEARFAANFQVKNGLQSNFFPMIEQETKEMTKISFFADFTVLYFAL